MSDPILVTTNWQQDIESIFGKIEIAPTESAQLALKLLTISPQLHSFEIGYIVEEEKDGVITKAQLTEVSLVQKPRMKEEDMKLIIFGWIVTILGIEPDIAKHEEWRLKVNELTDKLYDLMEKT